MKEHFGGKPTEHADEEGLVDQFVAFWIDQVKLEKQTASLLPLVVAVLQQTCKAGINIQRSNYQREHLQV